MNIEKSKITSIAIGGFDGMHIAHQTLFSNLTNHGAIVCIETGYANLTPKEDRQNYTIYPIFFYDLNNIKHLSGDQFVELLQNDFPSLRKIVVGFDFCFGKNRTHNTKDLQEIFHGEVVVVNEVKINDIAIHSRIIREYIKNGDIQTANTILGKKYRIIGSVIQGQGLGKKSFVPTLNMKVKDYLLPCQGVYISKTIVDNIEHNSVTFLGHRETTDEEFAIETHIIDKNIDYKNNTISVKFYQKIRPNKKFNSFNELKDQILKDIDTTKEYFKV